MVCFYQKHSKSLFLEETETEGEEVPNEMKSDLDNLQDLHKCLMEGSPIDEICSNQILSKTEDILATQKDNMHDNRTAKLWIQFMNMVAIFKTFIKAE